jgi:hypothetical protein
MWEEQSVERSCVNGHWKKPNRGPDGNWVLNGAGEIHGFLYDPSAKDRNRRYEVVAQRRASEETNEKRGCYVYRSADGMKWQQAMAEPVLRRTDNYMQPGPFWAKGAGDTSIFQYDAVLRTGG